MPYWFVAAAGLALLIPAGLVLLSVAGVEPEDAWDAGVNGLAAIALTILAYWAVGFGLQFGGVGLVYMQPELSSLVWEWSALPMQWGRDWGMAGLAGWFMGSPGTTSLIYGLFLAHLPWAATAALLPLMALRGRIPALAALFLSLLMGGIVYPLAGNWVQGGGWLAALGRNLQLGHGLVDFGGAGVVFLVSGSFTLAAILIWLPRSAPVTNLQLPPVQLPLLAVVGSLFMLAGSLTWGWINPLHVQALNEIAPVRGAVNALLSAAGGICLPLFYAWFVSGERDPLMAARGLAAGVVAGLAVGPFVPPAAAVGISLLAGATIPLITYIGDRYVRLNDTTGMAIVATFPAALGLAALGLWADGTVGPGWQMAGQDLFLGVAGQGVSGLWTAPGFQIDFPGQLQAQVIGVVALGLWGFVTGLIVCAPMAIILRGFGADADEAEEAGSGYADYGLQSALEESEENPAAEEEFDPFSQLGRDLAALTADPAPPATSTRRPSYFSDQPD